MEKYSVFVLISGVPLDILENALEKINSSIFKPQIVQMSCPGRRPYEAFVINLNDDHIFMNKEICRKIFKRLKTIYGSEDIVMAVPEGNDRIISMEFAPEYDNTLLIEQIKEMNEKLTCWSDAFIRKYPDGKAEAVIMLEHNEKRDLAQEEKLVWECFKDHIVRTENCNLNDNSKVPDRHVHVLKRQKLR